MKTEPAPQAAPLSFGGGGLFSGLTVAANNSGNDGPEAEEAGDGGSSFSFLNSGAAPAEEEPQQSSFSFLSSGGGGGGGEADEGEAPSTAFSFLNSNPDQQQQQQQQQQKPAASSGSSFSFVDQQSTKPEPKPASATKPKILPKAVVKKRRTGIRPGYAGKEEQGGGDEDEEEEEESQPAQPAQPAQSVQPAQPAAPQHHHQQQQQQQQQQQHHHHQQQASASPPGRSHSSSTGGHVNPETGLEDADPVLPASSSGNYGQAAGAFASLPRRDSQESIVSLASATNPAKKKDDLSSANVDDQISQIVVECETQLSRLKAAAQVLVKDKRAVIARQQQLSQELAEVRRKAAAAQADQALAVEREEFEKAGELESLSETLAERSAFLEKEIRAQLPLFEALEGKAVGVMESDISVREVARSRLLLLRSGQETLLNEYKTSSAQRVERAQKKIKEEGERLDRVVSDLNEDLKACDAETAEIRTFIDEETKDIKSKRDEVATRRTDLEAEIQSLKELLAQKEVELEQSIKQQKRFDAQISGVQLKYDTDLSRLAENRKRINASQQQRAQEMERFQLSRSKLEADMGHISFTEASFAESIQAITAQMESGASEIAKRNAQREALEEHRRRRSDILSFDPPSNPDLNRLTEDLATISSQIEELSAGAMKIGADMSRLRATVTRLETAIPELEAEKAIAVSSRNFKEAARISAELKTAQTDKENAVRDLEAFSQTLAGDQKSLEAKKRLYDDTKAKLAKRQYKCDVEWVQQLRRRVEEIRALAAEVDSNDAEEASFIRAVASTLDGEAAFLMNKHNLTTKDVEPAAAKGAAHAVEPVREPVAKPIEPVEDKKNEVVGVEEKEVVEQVVVPEEDAKEEEEEDKVGDEVEAEAEAEAVSSFAFLSGGAAEEEEAKPEKEEEEEVVEAEKDKEPEVPQEPEGPEMVDGMTKEEIEGIVAELESQLADLNTALEEAIAIEDFDKCEGLNAEIEDKTAEVAEAKAKLDQFSK